MVQAAAAYFGESGVGRVRDGNGRTALHFAAQVAQLDMARLLLEQERMDANVQDDHGAGTSDTEIRLACPPEQSAKT
jgi:ankyrin repeat protein